MSPFSVERFRRYGSAGGYSSRCGDSRSSSNRHERASQLAARDVPKVLPAKEKVFNMQSNSRRHDRSACVICIHATEHGWYGNTVPGRGTHCRDCGATWTGTIAAHTVCCHITFGGNSTADKYHDGFAARNNRCPVEADLVELGMVFTADRRGEVWRSAYAGPDAVRVGPNGHAASESPALSLNSMGDQ